MKELFEKFFENGLNEQEHAEVERVLDSSPEAAMEFAEIARRRFQELGLPLPSASGMDYSKLHGARLPRWIMNLAIAGSVFAAAGWAMFRGEETSQTSKSPRILRSSVTFTEKELEYSSAERKPRNAGSVADTKSWAMGNQLGVVVEMPSTGLVLVHVKDKDNKVVRELYNGILEGGSYRLPWDGTDSHGRKMRSGRYTVEVNRDGKTERRTVEIQN